MINKAIIVGRVGKDPDIRHMSNGDSVATLSVATSERWKDKNGEQQERTEWHRCVFFGKIVSVVDQYVKTGSLLYLEGKLQTRKWTDKDGVEKYTTEIVCNEMKLLNRVGDDDRSSSREEPRSRREEPKREEKRAPARREPPASFGDDSEEIPFANPYRGSFLHVI